jgi:hypothetical protein
MSSSAGVIPAVLISIGCVVLLFFVFRHFGATQFPWFVLFFVLVFAAIPLILVIGLLPYDISLCMFGAAAEPHDGLNITFEFFYWVSFLLSWVIVPVVISYQNLAYARPLRTRIWLAVRENLLFYGVIGALLLVGVLILGATGNLTFGELLPLAQTLGNLYGSILLCVTLGHAFIALPRLQWTLVTRKALWSFHCNLLVVGARAHAVAVKRAGDVKRLIEDAKDNLRNPWKDDLANGDGARRVAEFERLLSTFEPHLFQNLKWKPAKLCGKLSGVAWEKWGQSEYGNFMKLLDETNWDLKESWSFLDNEATGAIEASDMLSSAGVGTLYLVFHRALAVAIAVLNVLFLWGRIVLGIDPRLSVFYQISHCEVTQIVNMLFLSTPILSYYLFVGSWSLRQLNVFNGWYRFVRNATNANTLNYFSVLLCRLAPTIAWQYLQQIGANESEFEKVMGGGSVELLKGWNTIAEPILTVAAILFFGFRVPAKIAACCGRESFVMDYTVIVYTDERIANQLLNRIRDQRGIPREEFEEEPTRWQTKSERDGEAMESLHATLLRNQAIV